MRNSKAGLADLKRLHQTALEKQRAQVAHEQAKLQKQLRSGSTRPVSATSVEEINSIMKKYALEGELVEQIKYSLNNELVSSDIIGTSAPSIYDSNATIVSADGKNIVLYIWYDNEYGYSHQVIRLAKYIAKVRRYTYY